MTLVDETGAYVDGVYVESPNATRKAMASVQQPTPKQIEYDTGASSPNIDASPAMRDFNPGLYTKIGLRNSGAKTGLKVQGPYMTVKITFDGSLSSAYEVKAMRTGIKNLIG